MVYDFGGGTLDVTIIKVEDNHLTTMAISGDNNLGGQDLDNILARYI